MSNTNQTEQIEWIATSEAAQLVGVTSHTIRAWIVKAPKLAKRVGGRWRVRRDLIEQISAGTARVEDYV